MRPARLSCRTHDSGHREQLGDLGGSSSSCSRRLRLLALELAANEFPGPLRQRLVLRPVPGAAALEPPQDGLPLAPLSSPRPVGPRLHHRLRGASRDRTAGSRGGRS